MKKLFLIDAYALIYRSYYAFINSPMLNPAGQNVSAVFGFAKFMGDLISRECPDHLGVAFDPGGHNFRHELYDKYKANRQKTPDDILSAVPIIKDILRAMNIPILQVEGFEADDVIGTLSHKASLAGDYQTFMVTPDKDYAQLVCDNVFMYKPAKGGTGIEVLGRQEICAQFEIHDPIQVIDILALWGDASDNIPGVAGIGEKGAKKLVMQYGSVEKLLASTDQLKGRQRESLEAGAEQLMLSKQLATIRLDVPIEFEPDKLVMDNPDIARLREIYIEQGFRSLMRDLESDCMHRSMGGVTHSTTPYSAQVPELFDKVKTQITPAILPIITDETYNSIKDTTHEYVVIDTLDKLREMVEILSNIEYFAFDTETTSLSAVGTTIVGLSIAVEEHHAYWIPTSRGAANTILNELKPIFENPNIGKIGHNIKFDMLVLRNYGIQVVGRLYDTMIMHYLLDAESRHSMDFLATSLLGYTPVAIEDLIGRGAKQITMDRVAPQVIAEYGAEDADVTLQLFNVLWPEVAKFNQTELYETIEEPLISVLTDIEWAGVKVDSDILARSAQVLNHRLVSIEDEIRTTAGARQDININSPKQLGEFLFDVLQIDPKAKKTKTGQYKTDEETLSGLADRHEVVSKILEYRGVKKLLSTYVEALPLLINPKTGRLHTSFNQAVTATGRLSSSNPNLQNIPIRTEEGRAIRDAFVAADADSVIISADYSQVELRVMAHLAGDAAMRIAFENGEDIHTATAANIFKVAPSEVTQDERRKAKTANFGIIYGISGFGLAQRLGINRIEANQLINNYFALYPGVKKYMDDTIAMAREKGYVETIFHRRRTLPEINSANGNIRQNAERTAINTPIQGSAADIMKIAMIEAHRAIKEAGLKARIILQIHDEIVVDSPKVEAQQVIEILRRTMEGAAALTVPLIVETGDGISWRAAH
ncbi:MAG: DNA polymerase I [Mucinivorans sp.]